MMEEPRVSVLIVEDNPSWQMNYRELLEDEGYFVQVASTRQQAELLLKEQRFDLAIIDIRLDESDPNNIEGIRLAERIEALETKLPVIMTSGYGDMYKVPVKEVRERIVDFIDKGEVGAQRNLLDAVHRAIAIKRAEEEGLSEVGSLLREIIGKMVREYLDLPEIGLFILRKAAQFINAEHGNLLLVDGDEVVIAATTDRNLGARFDIDKCVTGLAVKRRATVNVPDVREEPYRSLFQPALGRDKRSELAVPAMMGEEVIAVLNFESPEVGAFTEIDERQLEILARPAAIAIDNARLHESLVRQAKRVTVLSEISGEINSIIEKGEEQVARTAVDRMLEFMACDKAAIFSLDQSKSKLRIAAHRGLDDEYVAGGRDLSVESVRATVVRTRKPLVTSDIQEDQRFKSVAHLAEQEGFRALLEQPLTVDGVILGTITAYYSNVHDFSEEEKGLAKTFAHHVAIAISNARNYEALKLAKKHERLALIGELSGDVVHRMNTPLSAIRANVQLIGENYPEMLREASDLHARLMKIQGIAERAMDVVEDMKAKARERKWELVDVQAMLNLALSKVDLPPDVRIDVGWEEDLPPVKASEQLAAVFQNLIANAKDAMLRPRCPTCRQFIRDTQVIEPMDRRACAEDVEPKDLIVRAQKAVNGHRVEVEVTVEDTGCGILPEWREEVMQAYFTTSQDQSSAHGLGLWYSQIYVEALGGSLYLVQGRGSKGTKAIVRLPAVEEKSS